MSTPIKKYPRTPHLEGSRLQAGDEDISRINFDSIAGKHLVIEEKIDGANVAVSFDSDGSLLLQSRGHYLVGGAREVHYDLLKQWANVHAPTLYDMLGDRYIMYGEWMYAKHKLFYDKLPHYFVEFDIFDRMEGCFLDTASRRALTELLPISSVPVLAEGVFSKKEDVLSLIAPSSYTSPDCIDVLKSYCINHGLDIADVLSTTDTTPLMEGLYIKVEENGRVTDRLKYVRASFEQEVQLDTQDWLKRTIIPNQLAVPLEDLFKP